VTVLALQGVRYRYAGATDWALDGIDLEVEAGEVVGITGANDAGKSTLCLVAAGLAPGSIGGKLEGSALIGGTESRELAPHSAAQRCGILFQNAATQLTGTTVTVWEEVAFGPRNLGLDLDAIIERVEWALRLARVEHLAERQPDRLSGGQAQLVALASVLALRPAVLILDEPTSQLDPAGTTLVGETLAGLARDTGTALLVVEHKTDLLARIADRVIVMAAGQVALDGAASVVLADPRLVELGADPPAAIRLRRLAEEAGVGPAIPRDLAVAITPAAEQ
jgi:energy-coupling factor transporter ATP-binding protein EcfA2